MLTTMYLIRHSEKMPLPFGYDRIQPLTARGERRAEALLQLEELRHADAAYCSPFARTVATLRYLAEADGLSLRLDDRLRELDFGGMPPEGGVPAVDIRARQWEDRDLRHEDGESLNQCCARMREVIMEIAREHAGKKVLVSTHGAALCAFLSGVIEGIDDDYARTLPQPAVFRLRMEGEQVLEVQRLVLPEGAR